MDTSRARTEGSFEALCRELVATIEAWPGGRPAAWSDEQLDSWARRAFRLQLERNEPYRLYCEARDVGPAAVEGWRDVPPVPSAAFRAVDLIVGSAADASVTFRTSGTTRGRDERGRHLVRSTALYSASLRAAFRALVIDDGMPRQLVTLPPSFTLDGNSSLGWMLDDLLQMSGAHGTCAASPDGVDWSALDRAIDDASAADRPVCVFGTTAGLAAWAARIAEGSSSATRLPARSLLVDTGGAKGLPPGVTRERVMRELSGRLGVSPRFVINEFGMTELLSQRYARGSPPGPLVGPPWLRSRVLDPVTLEEVAPGETGILCHYDLANLGSVCAVLTEDRGRVSGPGIEWLGRTPGAVPRGCSLATAELLAAQRDA